MFAKYQISEISFDSSSFVNRGVLSEKKMSSIISESIEKFVGVDGTVNAKAMMDDWFPQIEADVFISHSHADENLALSLSGWLEENFGLRPFVDSCVWKHAKNLIRILDNAYCKTGDNLYSYEDSLVTASHVHMMLSTALTQMMDRCECVFFLRTENSTSSKDPEEMVKGNNASTYSPWLFHEISMMKFLRQREKTSTEKEYY